MVFRATCGECLEVFVTDKIFDLILSNNEPPYNKSIRSILICTLCGAQNQVVDKAYNESVNISEVL